ncbi:helix-turn-helix domain-containing protein [Dactylosporangium sp. NPDC049140]|uniref:helix-turn-helix transcriptional regulator n=1 Tax=Dactylosporangium sp. NPDC049140 TaxID=3155647 RepID=UPI0033D759A2
MAPRPLPDRIAAVAALDDPARRAVFDLVTRAGAAVSRDAAADALGVSRRVAAFHLDRLAEQGLLVVEYRRPPGRGGPGAGRPAKLYRRTDDEVAVSVPERHYEMVGGLLAAAVTESIDTGAPVQEVLHRTAYDAGKTIGAAADNLPTALADAGYDPQQQADAGGGGVVLRNCPFHRLAQQFTPLVCGVNLQLLRGVADGTGDTSYVTELDPGPGRCCVRLRPGDAAP